MPASQRTREKLNLDFPLESLLLVLLVSRLEERVTLLKILRSLLLLRISHVLLLLIYASLFNQIKVLVPRAELPVTLVVLVSSSGRSLSVISIPSGF